MALNPTPFSINFRDDEIIDLKSRLSKTRLPEKELTPLLEGWDYGTNLTWLKAMVLRWEIAFDFKKLQRDIAQWPHFKVNVEDIGIHFIHVRSRSPSAKPILLVHGWPGSFFEFRHLINRLVEPDSPKNPAFHVVVPSLPGYTYSETPSQRGWTMEDNARVFNKLMVGLGYSKYICQGGDWGHQVCRTLGSNFTENCKLVYLNMCPAPPPKSFTSLQRSWIPYHIRKVLSTYLFTPIEEFLCNRSVSFASNGLGYAQMQGTRPATVGYALLDTPVGHLSWLGEKWTQWSDSDSPSPHLFYESDGQKLMSDDILANVSLYWFTKSILTSFIPYLENRDNSYKEYAIKNITNVLKRQFFISVPLGMSNFKHELAGTTKAMVAKSGNLTFYREHEKGGHFAALDRPDELLLDIYDFYRMVNGSYHL